MGGNAVNRKRALADIEAADVAACIMPAGVCRWDPRPVEPQPTVPPRQQAYARLELEDSTIEDPDVEGTPAFAHRQLRFG
jgi:hypothetical protein